jgi:hypothetical protein
VTCRVVNLRKSEYDVYIGRAGKGQSGYFGNPYSVSEYGDEAIPLFRKYFYDRLNADIIFKVHVLSLKNLTLGCFCAPRACHGDIIAEWVNAQDMPKQPSLF